MKKVFSNIYENFIAVWAILFFLFISIVGSRFSGEEGVPELDMTILFLFLGASFIQYTKWKSEQNLKSVDSENESVTKDKWVWVPITLDLKFSEDEYLKMKKGFIAKDMDSRWNFYFKGDVFILERSWFENPMYKLNLKQSDNGWVVNDGLVYCSATAIQGEGWEKIHKKTISEVLSMLFTGEGLVDK